MKEARRQGNKISGGGLHNIFRQAPSGAKGSEGEDPRRPSSPSFKHGLRKATVGRLKSGSVSDDTQKGSRSPLNRTSSLFYTDRDSSAIDVTTIFIRPDRDFPQLDFNGKSSAEIIELIKSELLELNNMILPVSTGSGSINMSVGVIHLP